MQSARAEGAVRSACGAVAGRVGIAAVLVVALLPACESQRLVLFKVYRDRSLDEGVVIVSLEARTSPVFKGEQHVTTRGDAGNTNFPKLMGVYLHPRSGTVSIRVFAYGEGDKLVAAGQIDGVDTGSEQVAEDLFLFPCLRPAPDKTTLCEMPAPPDGGDVGTVAEAGVDTDASVSDADARSEVGDGPSSDRQSDLTDAPADWSSDLLDVRVDGTDADALADQPEAGDAPETGPETGADALDGGDGGSDVPIPGPDPGAIPPDCVEYCGQVLAVCPNDFASERDCEADCTFAQLASQDGVLACRTGRLNRGCAQPSLLSAFCDPSYCEVYCALGASVCGQSLFLPDFCLSDDGCLGLDVGQVASDVSGDTLACRMYWLQQAVDDLRVCNWSIVAPTAGPCRAQ